MKNNEFKLLNKIMQTNNFIFKILDNYPRKDRDLKTRMSNECFNLVSYCNLYNINTDYKAKYDYLMLLLGVIANLNYFLSLSFDRRNISRSQFFDTSRFLREEREMTYGLIKYLNTKHKDELKSSN